MSVEHFDVLIVGAGLSGIGAAYHLQKNCPERTYAILEGRENSGGTWDLFKYPGIRSDSDMFTLGYSFKPWQERKAIADGPSILNYIRETASENGIDRHIRYGLHVERSAWSTEDSRWTVETEKADGQVVTFTCNYLFMCSGYYNYAEGYTPDFEGVENFKGEIAHPQKWTSDIQYKDKKVVVIGSGATAVTLVPEMAKDAGHVTMLQRSPTYIASRPSEDGLANKLRKYLPAKLAYGITRWKNVLMGMYFYNYSRKNPETVARMLIKGVKNELGPDFDVKKHFTPRYNPWDQRLCAVPDGDLFAAIRNGQASVVTDVIDHFTETGIKLTSGQELEADLVVMATGLKLQLLSGMEITVDNQRIDLSNSLTYKGMMFSDVPNLALSMGYTNASWTLKSDLTAGYVCRLLNYMENNGYTQCCPRTSEDDELELVPFMDFASGYVQRAMESFPKQATSKPWMLNQNYAKDLVALGFGSLKDEAMEFKAPYESKLDRNQVDAASLESVV